MNDEHKAYRLFNADDSGLPDYGNDHDGSDAEE